MKKILPAILLTTALSLLPLPSAADEAEAKMQIEAVATGLFASLPSGKKVVLKTVSPEESGLPADFLGKLTSDLEAALLVASEFEIDLVNRQTTEELWAEAIEFNNADFGALQAASGADVALMLTARATEARVEIALTAYSLDTADAGKVLASSGSTILALDMQQNMGLDVNSLNDQMAQVLAEIEKVGQTGGLISDPNTYAEYYHNARILQQRGESDLALVNFEEAIKLESRFADPVLTLIELAQARYGKQASRKYFEAKIFPFVSVGIRKYIELHLSEDPSEFLHYIIHGDIKYLPFLADWFWMHGVQLKSERSDAGVDFKGYDYAILKSARALVHGVETGALQEHFIDKVEASRRYRVSEARSIIRELNRAEYALFERDYVVGSLQTPYLKRPECVLAVGNSPMLTNADETRTYDELQAAITEYKPSCQARPELGFFDPNVAWLSAGIEEVVINLNFEENSPSLVNLPIRHHFEASGPCYTLLHGRNDWKVGASGFEQLDFGRPLTPKASGPNAYDPTIAISAHELHPAFDRMIFADVCASVFSTKGMVGTDGVVLPTPPIGMKTRVRGIAGLIITDEVDVSKPIRVHFHLPIENGPLAWTDISRDGTYFSERGAPLGGLIGEYAYEFEGGRNSWLFAPGIVQSMLYKDHIARIDYTNKYGERIELDNIAPVDMNTINAEYWSVEGDGKGKYVLPSEDYLAQAWINDGVFLSDGAEEQVAEMSWVQYQEYLPIIHLGDEQLDGWPPVNGSCLKIAFDDVPAGGQAGLTYEPYGVESLYLILPDGTRFDLPSQDRKGASRPNYWGEETSFSINTVSGAKATVAHLCAGNIKASDVDDLMVQNVRTWTYK